MSKCWMLSHFLFPVLSSRSSFRAMAIPIIFGSSFALHLARSTIIVSCKTVVSRGAKDTAVHDQKHETKKKKLHYELGETAHGLDSICLEGAASKSPNRRRSRSLSQYPCQEMGIRRPRLKRPLSIELNRVHNNWLILTTEKIL